MMDYKAVFEKVKTHLLTQMKKALKDDTGRRCMYRTEDGLMCAIGCLIPDDLYETNMEHLKAYTLFRLKSELAQRLSVNLDDASDLTFLSDLQEIHDEHDVEEWPRELEKFKLKYIYKM